MQADRQAPPRRDVWMSGVPYVAACVAFPTLIFGAEELLETMNPFVLFGLFVASLSLIFWLGPRLIARDLPSRIFGVRPARPTDWGTWLGVWWRLGDDSKRVLTQMETVHGPSPIPWDASFHRSAGRVRTTLLAIMMAIILLPVLAFAAFLVAIGLGHLPRGADVLVSMAKLGWAPIVSALLISKILAMNYWCRWYLRQLASRPQVPAAPPAFTPV